MNLKSNLFCTDETKGSQDVTIANASDKAITVQVLPIHMVQQQELSERHFGIGVACDGQLGFQVIIFLLARCECLTIIKL